jgi:hypothetical protein
MPLDLKLAFLADKLETWYHENDKRDEQAFSPAFTRSYPLQIVLIVIYKLDRLQELIGGQF